MTDSAEYPPFELVRRYPHPLADVWRAWTDAEALASWWGPSGCEVEALSLELRPGGFFHYAMHIPGAPTSWGRFNYREIVPQQRIVWLNSFANAYGGIARAPFPGDIPMEVTNAVTFDGRDGVTTLQLRAEPFGAEPKERAFFASMRASLEGGYGGTFEQLAEHLAGQR
ncbi:MAG: SRPBCC domain-containing protein [Lautropia sp.]